MESLLRGKKATKDWVFQTLLDFVCRRAREPTLGTCCEFDRSKRNEYRDIQSFMLVRKVNRVLSFCPDRLALQSRESALRNNGFEVISVWSEIRAQFEIEVGRCGILLTCFRVSERQIKELADLFRRNCPDGQIILMTNDRKPPIFAEAVVPEHEGVQTLVSAAIQISSKGFYTRR